MKILVAPDSFKGSLKSPGVARAMAKGLARVAPEAEIVELPVGDGGEGTLEALVVATGGSYQAVEARDPLGRPIAARIGLLGDGETVFVEMAEASGLSRLAVAERDPLVASTYGTGQLLRAAAATGRPHILVGLGGSATVDGGAGALQALGVRLEDERGQPLPPGGGALGRLRRIDADGGTKLPDLVLACDVTNPLTGPDGAAAIYGPQKGASPDAVATLDAGLAHFAQTIANQTGRDLAATPGAGAAGGLAFGLLAFSGARIERGVERVLDAVELDARLEGADLVLTGEGRLDGQTLAYGKTITGIGARARRAGVPVIALAGSLAPELDGYQALGISGVGSIIPGPLSLDDAMERAPELIERAAARLLEIFLARRNHV